MMSQALRRAKAEVLCYNLCAMNRLAIVRLLALAAFLVSAAGQNSSPPSLAELMQKAQAGDAVAQAELARDYEEGNGAPQNDELAAEWYRKSAEQGNARAQNSLGSLYWRGRGVARDREEAVRWYKRAAKLGLAEGAYNVAISYYNGEGVPYDLDLAYAWMEISKTRGDAQAADELKRIGGELKGRYDSSKMKLALIYEKGEEVAQDLSAAAALYTEVGKLDFRQSAYVGEAQYKLCQFYAAGRGVLEDLPQARSWCKKAAKNGATLAYIALGKMAEQGLGGEENLKEAADWYRDAALFYVPEGFMELGRLKSQGRSHEDQREAYFWFYLGQKVFFKNPNFNAPVQQAATLLSDKEIADQQKRAAAWLRMRGLERSIQIKRY